MKQLFTSALLLTLSITSFSQIQKALPINNDNNSLLWEISGKGLKKKSYLFGTFHLMCKDDILITQSLKQSIANSKEVYMELDMDDPKMMLAGMSLMSMRDGKKLKDLYTDDEYKKLSAYFNDTLRTPINFLETMKPYFLVAMLYPKMMPCKKVSGVEEEIMKVAKTNKKDIKGLETMEFQASVFDSISYEEQAKELLKSIDSLDNYKAVFDTMVQVYKSQQIAGIEKVLTKSEFGMQEHADVLLDNRNKNWIVQLKKIMPTKPVFVAVGAGHLVGQNGVIALLKKEGYVVKPIKNK